MRTGYEALLAQVDRRIDLLVATPEAAGDAPGAAEETETRAVRGRGLLRRMVIETERDELDRLVARRRVSRPVAADVRAALDVDETTMRP